MVELWPPVSQVSRIACPDFINLRQIDLSNREVLVPIGIVTDKVPGRICFLLLTHHVRGEIETEKKAEKNRTGIGFLAGAF